MLVDVHCHIDMCRRPAQEVVAGDVVVVANGTDLESNKKVLSYAKLFPNVHAALGLYPCTAEKLTDREISECLRFIEDNRDRIVAVGEVGIDFYHTLDSKSQKRQIEVFREVVKLANKIKKPLIIHSRRAVEETLKLLKAARVPVLLHCFQGTQEQTDEAIGRGYYFTSTADFWKRKGFKKTAKRVPIDRLLTETDSPFLSPIEGENRPQNVKFAVEKLSGIKGLTKMQVESQIFLNFRKLFRIRENLNN